MFSRYVRPAGSLVIALTLLLGVVYPLVVTVVGSALFPSQAAGSLVYAGKTLIGSPLVGQKYSGSGYFWGRPSATSPQPYNGMASGASNLGPLNPALLDAVDANVKLLHEADPSNADPIPIDLVTASGSGLDPDISWASADYQSARVAPVRHLPLSAVQSLIQEHRNAPLAGILGEHTVNVMELNRALDSLH